MTTLSLAVLVLLGWLVSGAAAAPQVRVFMPLNRTLVDYVSGSEVGTGPFPVRFSNAPAGGAWGLATGYREGPVVLHYKTPEVFSVCLLVYWVARRSGPIVSMDAWNVAVSAYGRVSVETVMGAELLRLPAAVTPGVNGVCFSFNTAARAVALFASQPGDADRSTNAASAISSNAHGPPPRLFTFGASSSDAYLGAVMSCFTMWEGPQTPKQMAAWVAQRRGTCG